MFHSEIYIQRRKILRERIGSGLILFLGNDECPMNFPDNPYHFRQHSSFLYYFGIDFPALAAVIDIDNNREIIFGDDLTIDDIIWKGKQESIKDMALESGIEEVLPMVKLYTILKEAQASRKDIHFLPPYRPENKIKLLRFLNIRPDQVNINASVELVKAVVAQREIKSKEEIDEIRKAVDISVDIQGDVISMIEEGIKESEIVARVIQIARANNCQMAFPIVATINGHIIHNYSYKNVLKKGDLFLLNAGVEIPSHYASDLSVTIPVSKSFTQSQKEIYQVVLDAQQVAEKMLRPGASFLEVHFAVCRCLVSGLKQMGIMKGSVDDAVSVGAHSIFFPGGTGHLLGIDVHDMEDLGELWVGFDGQQKSSDSWLKFLKLGKTIKSGHVLTIEPGIYFIPDLINLRKAEGKFDDFIHWNVAESFVNFGGVRIGDNFEIKEEGCFQLGKKRPKTINELISFFGT